jgi:glycosyltransferase involved in cell wall biosynthesis
MQQSQFPVISLVVPNFNQARFLAHALDSILLQHYSALDLIVIDGGSSDGSVDIIKERSHQLSFWCSEPDSGHYDAVNKGMARAKGDILGFLNSDDMLLPGSLRALSEVFAAYPEVEWVTSLYPVVWDATGICIRIGSPPGYCKAAFLDGMYGGGWNLLGYIQQESTFWRRSVWDRAGGRIRNEFSHAGDFDLWGRFFQVAELYGIGAALGGFRIREGQRGGEGNLYRDQASAALSDFRRVAGWSAGWRTWLRRLCLPRCMFRYYKLGSILRCIAGYCGNRIVRRDPGRADGRWEIEEYRFP